MDRRSLTHRREKPRDLYDHGAAGAIVDRGSSDPVTLKRDRFRRIDHGRTDLDAGGQGGFGAREARVDDDLLVGDDAVLVLRTCRVVALVADDCADVASLANADEKLLRGERPFGDAPSRSSRMNPPASTFRTTNPSWSMWANSITLGRLGSPSAVAIRLPSRSVVVVRPKPAISAARRRRTRPSCPLRPGISMSSIVSARSRSRDGPAPGAGSPAICPLPRSAP